MRGGVVGGRIEMLTVLKKQAKMGLKHREAEGTERQRAATQRCLKKRRKPEEPPRRWESPKESEDVPTELTGGKGLGTLASGISTRDK